jgi:hypothetical protein
VSSSGEVVGRPGLSAQLTKPCPAAHLVAAAAAALSG